MAATGTVSFAFGLMPVSALAFVSLAMTCFFLASIWLRLFAGAASTASVREPYRPVVEDRWLPVYSVVVALHREARVVPQLIAALDAIDYTRSKLDIKLVIEHDDHATRRTIEALHLPAIYEIVIAPAGWPRTKPRALNVALPLVRGDFLVIFDAEDAPAAGQLREAAERFLRSPRELACLHARLAIDGNRPRESNYQRLGIIGSVIGYATRQIERARRNKNGLEHGVTPRRRFLARTKFDNIDHLRLQGSRNAHAHHQISID